MKTLEQLRKEYAAAKSAVKENSAILNAISWAEKTIKDKSDSRFVKKVMKFAKDKIDISGYEFKGATLIDKGTFLTMFKETYSDKLDLLDEVRKQKVLDNIDNIYIKYKNEVKCCNALAGIETEEEVTSETTETVVA